MRWRWRGPVSKRASRASTPGHPATAGADPRARPRWAALAALLLVAGTALTVQPSAASATSIGSSLSVSAEGETLHVSSRDQTFQANTYGTRTHLNLYIGSRTLFLLAPANTSALVRGWYAGAWDYADAQGHPGINVSIGGSGCSQVGHFEIRDIAYNADNSLNRLWVLFEARCLNGPDAQVGELRYRMPVSAGAQVQPTSTTWPSSPLGQPAPAQSVQLTNTGSSALSVTQAAVRGWDASAFSVQSNRCTGVTVAPGKSCTVTVAHTPTRRGPQSATLSLTLSDGRSRTVQLDGSGRPGRTRLVLDGEEGEYLTGGGTQSFAPSGQTVRFYNYVPDTMGVTALGTSSDGRSATLILDPGSQQRFVAGSTVRATTYPAPHPYTDPSFGMYVNGRSCNTSAGTFTVHSVQYDAADRRRLHRLDASFLHRCNGEEPALRGRIELGSGEAVPPARAANATTRRNSDGTLTLRWTNPSDGDWSRTMVRMLSGSRAPGSPLSGRPIYAGRGSQVTLSLGTGTWSFSIWTTDTSGNTGSGTRHTKPAGS